MMSTLETLTFVPPSSLMSCSEREGLLFSSGTDIDSIAFALHVGIGSISVNCKFVVSKLSMGGAIKTAASQTSCQQEESAKFKANTEVTMSFSLFVLASWIASVLGGASQMGLTNRSSAECELVGRGA